jgi:transposase-like protein
MNAPAAGAPLAGQVLYQFKIRRVKYLNNVVEQDHRAIKRIIRPMLGFKDFRCTRVILSGIDIMHMIVKGQMVHTGKIKLSAACQFYSLVT